MCQLQTWALTFWWGLMDPGLHMTIPLLTSSRLSPRTRAPRLSPASARSRDLWNISIPEHTDLIRLDLFYCPQGEICYNRYIFAHWMWKSSCSPVITDLKLRLWPINSASSPFLMIPRSMVPVTTVPLPVRQQLNFKLQKMYIFMHHKTFITFVY